jgi:hypothetical protein
MSNNDKTASPRQGVAKPGNDATGALKPKLTAKQIIKEASQLVNKHISRQPPVQRFFSFMPTMLTRVSPFHFKGRYKLNEWPLVRLDSGGADAWGGMHVVGELLVIFDETILFCLLALMARYESDAFETSQTELAQIAGIDPMPTTAVEIWKSIQRLAGTRIDLQLYSGRGKKRRTLTELTGSILSFADKNQTSGKIRAVINPYFMEMYAESFVTNIDLAFRCRLKSDISKAFYRFYQGQYDRDSEIELTRLARAVNLKIEPEMSRLRSKVRTGLSELQAHGYLQDYQITPDNRVRVTKAADTAVKMGGQILGKTKMGYLGD